MLITKLCLKMENDNSLLQTIVCLVVVHDTGVGSLSIAGVAPSETESIA